MACSEVIFILLGWLAVGDTVVNQKTMVSLGLAPEISILAFESREGFKWTVPSPSSGATSVAGVYCTVL